MKGIISVLLALFIVGAFYSANSFGINLWLVVFFFLLGSCAGLVMILIPVPLVLFALSLVLAGSIAISFSLGQDTFAIASGLSLASMVLFLHYFVWLRGSANE